MNEMDRRRWFRLWRDMVDEITQFMHQHPAMPISEQMTRFERLQVRMAEVRAEAARLRDESSDREPLPDDHPPMIVETWTFTIDYPDGDDAGLPPEPGEEREVEPDYDMQLEEQWLRQQDERGER